MNLEILITICSALSLTLYIIYFSIIWAKFGILSSISTSWYKWEELRKGSGIYFSMWCGMIGGLVLPPLLYLTYGDWWWPLSFISVLGIWFVGIAPDFTNKKYYPWHVTGALMAAFGGVILCILEGYWIPTLIFISLNFLIQRFTTKYDLVLWLENGCFFTVMLCPLFSIYVTYYHLILN